MKPAIGYLVSRYPAYSHTFIQREIQALRERDFTIQIASVNEPDQAPDDLTGQDANDYHHTYYLKRHGFWGALAAQTLLWQQPHRYLAGLGLALRLGGTDPVRLLYGLFYFIEALMMSRWLTQHGITHLHVHFATPAANVGLLTKRLSQCSLSITVHGPDEFYDVPGYRLVEKMHGADFVVCIGHFARSQLWRLVDPGHWPKFEICPLGVDPAQFTPRPHPTTTPFTVVCVGRLVPAKGQRILLEAVAKLVQSGRSLQLALIGDGPDRARLEAACQQLGIEQQVALTGALPQQAVYQHYTRAHAFALASFAEGIPVVLMEAMAMTIPCVTTWITGIPELIRPEQDGLLVAPGDVDGLAAALIRLMDDPTLRQQLGEAGRQRILERYHLSTNVGRLAEVFSQRLLPNPTL